MKIKKNEKYVLTLDRREMEFLKGVLGSLPKDGSVNSVRYANEIIESICQADGVRDYHELEYTVCDGVIERYQAYKGEK